MTPRAVALAVAAGLAMADASIVTLALPEILRELDTTIEGVAAVIAVYTLVIAVALLPLERVASRTSVPVVGACGFALLAVASAVCAAANSLPVLLVARSAQALGGAAGLATVFELVGGVQGVGRKLWLGAAVFATALGPAIGGALTQVFSWRAIFVFQVPVGVAGAIAVLAAPGRPIPREAPPARRVALRPMLALGLVSAALSAVLFLLVLLLVAGWNISPLGAAALVTVIPIAALLGARIPGDQHSRAVAGCALVGGGVLALAWLPTASVWWTIAPQLVAGVGMGLALTALGGGLLPERTPRDAARLLTVRYAGIAALLAIAAPVAAHQLPIATLKAREQGVALVLDASLPPLDKIKLAPALLKGVESNQPRAGLRHAVAEQRRRFTGADRAIYDKLGRRADETLTSAVGDAFRTPFLLSGAAGFLAALVLLAGARAGVVLLTGAVAVGTPLAYAGLYRAVAPEPPAILDPCTAHRKPPSVGGVTGLLQRQALVLLDKTACRLGSSREELVLALADKDDARRFQREHGVNPRTLGGLLQALLGG
ncbi:MAG TPA: MFS transporter [Thermoleophilaceae bacterium]|jgi:predicted MFS family arabinose efflux permease|nr:MFS transporter [Thermoleophilaceae bacterium]